MASSWNTWVSGNPWAEIQNIGTTHPGNRLSDIDDNLNTFWHSNAASESRNQWSIFHTNLFHDYLRILKTFTTDFQSSRHWNNFSRKKTNKKRRLIHSSYKFLHSSCVWFEVRWKRRILLEILEKIKKSE